MISTPPAPAQTPTGNSVCPRCGAGFRCGMVAGDTACWCADMPLLAGLAVPVVGNSGVAEKLPPAASCFCPACLKSLTEPTETKSPPMTLSAPATNAPHLSLPAITPIADATLQARLQHKIDHKTKPLGALGRLEGLALQLGLIQRSETVIFRQPQLVVFAADHGVADEGVSAFPQAVTVQMVANMLAGGAAINVFARQHGFDLQVVDAGVAAEISPHPQLLQRKVALGTRNLCTEPAMTQDQALLALHAGMQIVQALPGNVVAFGEMGIGNTSAATLLLARLAGVSLMDATGRGTGLSDEQLARKQRVLARALARQPAATAPLEALADLGGFEIAMMTGAMLQAASERRVVLVDGFIAGAAALVAHALVPGVKDYLVFCHSSAERGHELLLTHLNAQPLLTLDLRLGEGSGALLAWPLLQSAAAFLNEMASFESAGVSGKAAEGS